MVAFREEISNAIGERPAEIGAEERADEWGEEDQALGAGTEVVRGRSEELGDADAEDDVPL